MILKKKFLEHISFSTPKAIVINFLSAFAILKIVPAEKFQSYCVFKNFIFPLIFKSCPTKGLFVSCNCPACGLTRATSYFLHGNFLEASKINKLVFIIVPFIIGLIIYNLFKIIKTNQMSKVTIAKK